MNSTRQDQLRLRLTAFFFNNRADALRSEMYRALCLASLAGAQDPKSVDQIADDVISMLGGSVDKSDSLRTVLSDELSTLNQRGEADIADGRYSLAQDHRPQVPDEEVETKILTSIAQEIKSIALSITPTLSANQIGRLEKFFFEAATLIADNRLPLITRPKGSPRADLTDEGLIIAVSELRIQHELDQFTDADKFIISVFIRPTKLMGEFLHRLYQVTVIMALLGWDPSLEYLQNQVLARVSLYLDSNILFVLMQSSNPLHIFARNLLTATRNDLGVRIAVHQNTLNEYEQVIEWANSQFEHVQQTLKDVARICISDGVDPADYLENSIHTDYLSLNLNHVDLGSWQRYVNAVSREAVEEEIKALGMYIDKSSAFVPNEEFDSIRDAMRRASKVQVKRGKRKDIKLDTHHDAQIFHLISSSRSRSPDGELSLGFDKYLLTLDGSLIFFLREYGIPWTETFFMFPNQWYELSFPFFRVKYANQAEFTSAAASLAFSPAFPTLAQLMPLQLCSYVFELGGTNLSMASLRETVQSAVEGRFLEKLDPSNTDLRSKEESKLQVQRLIAEMEAKQRGELDKAQEEISGLREEGESLMEEVRGLGSTKVELDERVKRLKGQVKKYPTREAEIAAVREIYEEDIAERKQTIRDREATIEDFQERIESIENREEDRAKREQAEKERERAEKEREQAERRAQLEGVRTLVITILMIAGLLVSAALLIDLSQALWVILASLLLMSVGTVLFQRPARLRLAFISYSLGTIFAAYFILNERELSSLLWIIPMAWQVVIFGLNRVMDRKFDRIQPLD